MLARRYPSIQKQRAWIPGSLLFLILIIPHLKWRKSADVLPLVCAAGLIWVASRLFMKYNFTPARYILSLWIGFSVGMLSRMMLNPRYEQYGFTQAAPATLLCVSLMLEYLPAAVQKFAASRPVRWISIAIVLSFALSQLEVTAMYIAEKNYPVQASGNSFITYSPDMFPELRYFLKTKKLLDEKPENSTTVLPIPEGAMLSFLTRRPNPSGYVQLTMSEVSTFGQSNILAAFKSHSPDFVILVHKYWPPLSFGSSEIFGKPILIWVYDNYQVDKEFGDRPFDPKSVAGMWVLKRKM
jgi:hypothetical protein